MKNQYRIRGDHAVIYVKTRSGKLLFVLVDAQDIEKLSAIPYKWYACKCSKSNNYYIYGQVDGNVIALHRYITDTYTHGMGTHVDHKNNNTLDNRKCNLRALSPSGNHQNRKGASKNSKAGVRGVYWSDEKMGWVAFARLNGKSVCQRKFDSKKYATIYAAAVRAKYMPHSKDALNKKMLQKQLREIF